MITDDAATGIFAMSAASRSGCPAGLQSGPQRRGTKRLGRPHDAVGENVALRESWPSPWRAKAGALR
jgi:hypothetical protein